MHSQQTNIFLVRHGQTEWNRQHRIQGHQDSPLTPLGKQQAEQTRKALSQFDIQQAFVSPLKRAQDSAEIILQGRSLQSTTLTDLREIRLGPWEGKTRSETVLSHPEEHNSFWHSPDSFALAGAETFLQLQQRIVNTLENIFSQAITSNVLVVSHWIAIKVALAYYQDIPIAGLANMDNPENGAFQILSKNGSDVSITD